MKRFIALFLLSLAAITTNVFATPMGDAIEKAVANHSQQINVAKFGKTVSEAGEEFTYFASRSPLSWKVSTDVKYQVSGGKVSKIIIDYKYSTTDEAEKQAFISKSVNEIVARAEKENSDYDKARLVYDYLIDNYKYDKGLTYKTSYDLYSKKTGVCRSYAIAYREILNRLGIECDVVTSKTMAHQWNVVKIGEVWYNVDASAGDLWEADKDEFFMKSDLFFSFLGYTDGKAYNGISCDSDLIKEEN